MQFEMETYEADSADDVMASFESEHSFMIPSAGEFINPNTFADNEYSSRGQLLKVVSVQHIFWESDRVYHQKLCIYTTAVPNQSGSKPKRNTSNSDILNM